MKILLVDDSEAMRQVGVELLEQAGHTVDTAHDNKGAMALYKRNPYDVVLTDAEHLEETPPDGMEGLVLAKLI